MPCLGYPAISVVRIPGPTHLSCTACCSVYNFRAEKSEESDEALNILWAKEAGERPPQGALQHWSVEDQHLLQLWDQLIVEDIVFYCHTGMLYLEAGINGH